MKRLFAAVLFLVMAVAAASCFAEGKTVEEIRMEASLGEMY